MRLRERRNMEAASVEHRLEPKRVRYDGKMSWCCPSHMQQSIEQGVRDEWTEEHGYVLTENGWEQEQ